jgi:hypothetical protein
MAAESPQNPRPDDLPEDQRTGDEPNPSGKAPARKDHGHPPFPTQ